MISLTAVVPFFIDATGMPHILIIDNDGNYEVGTSANDLTAVDDILKNIYKIFPANIRTVFDIAHYELDANDFVRVVAAELFNPGMVQTPPFIWINANDMRFTNPQWANIMAYVYDYIKSRYRSNPIQKIGKIRWMGSVI
jgi:hypothetical protein